jgi:integrase
MRAEVDHALIAAKLPPLTDWTATWHQRAAAIREDLDTRGHAVVGWEADGDGVVTVQRWESIKADAEEDAEVVRRRQGAVAAEQFLKAATSEGLSVGQARRQWLEDERRRVKPTTIVSHQGAFAKLERFISGHHSLPSLDVTEFAHVTRRVAGEFMQDRRADSSGATVLREFSAYSGLWRWALRRGYVETNPWSDQTAGLKSLREDEHGSRERAFTTAELVTLLHAGNADLAPNRGALGATFWDAIRLALLTGTRASELVDMTVAGVIEDGTALAVAGDPTRRGKTAAASRIVPLHSIAQGVLKARLASLKDLSPDAPLWPELPPGGANKSRAKTFATRFVIMRRRVLGLSDEVDFHSLRRTWMTAAETAMHAHGRINDALIGLLGGHKRGSLALDLYSDWTRMGWPHMAGKLADKLTTLRDAVEDVVGLGMPGEVLTALEETQGNRPPVVRVKPAFARS